MKQARAEVFIMPLRPKDDIADMVDAELAIGAPRSAEYRLGMIDCLRARLRGAPLLPRYQIGSAAADAWFAGTDRGWAMYRRLQEARG